MLNVLKKKFETSNKLHIKIYIIVFTTYLVSVGYEIDTNQNSSFTAINKLLPLKICNWQKCNLSCVYSNDYEAYSHEKNSLKIPQV